MIGLRLLRAGAAERKDLDKIRGQIESAGQEIEDVRDAPLPLTEATARLMEHVRPQIEVARSGLLAFMRPGSWPLNPAEVPADLRHPLVATLVAEALFRPAAFDKSVASLLSGAGKPGLAAAERQRKLAELQAKVEQLETDEEMEIVRLEAAGYCVERRVEVPIERLLR
ncbi:MAG: hypothetical protein AB7I32_14990, partial [Gammaproteobacteria bacterium]